MKPVTYIKRTVARADRSQQQVSDFVDWVSGMILEDLQNEMAGKEVTASLLDKLFKAERWDRYAREINRERNALFDSLWSSFKSDIKDLKAIYGDGAEFFNEDLKSVTEPIRAMIISEISAVISSRDYLAREAEALRYSFIASQYTGNADRLLGFLKGQLKPNRNVKTEFRTATENIYQKVRNDFFEKLPGEEKVYEYMGVRVASTRPFCDRNIGKQRTKEQWKKQKNGQNGTAWGQRGGYNCQHILLLVPGEA